MKLWALALATLLPSAVIGRAETVHVNLLSDPSPGLSGSVSVNFQYGSYTTSTTTVGAFKWDVTSDTGLTFSGNVAGNIPLYTFCIQAFQTVGSSYTVTSLDGGLPLGGKDAGAIDTLAAAQIQGLVDRYWGTVDFTHAVSTNYSFNSVSYSDDQVAAAFQLALWEIEYDGGTGGETFGSTSNYFAAGNLRASKTGDTAHQANGQAAIDLANGWLNNFSPDYTFGSIVLASSDTTTWYGTTSGYQDQLSGIPNPSSGAQPVPLPAALPGGLGLIAALGLFGKVRRKLRA